MTEQKWELIEQDGRMVVDGPIKTVTGPLRIDGELTFADDAEPEPAPEPDPAPDVPPDNGDLKTLIKAAVEETLLNAPDYPDDHKVDGRVDARDVVPTISHSKLYRTRWRDAPIGGTPDAPGQAPVIVQGETDETLITAFGARGESYAADTKALEEAGKRTTSGGVIKVPIGRFKIDQANLPSHKNWTLRGTSMRGSELVSAPGKDIIRVTGWNAQRRLQNQHIYDNIGFYLTSKSQSHDHSKEYNRRSWSGWPVAHCAIAYEQEKHSDKSEERKHNWVNSYPILDRVFVRADKNSMGPTAFFAENCVYGLKIFSLFIGDHATQRGGCPGGVILGKPPKGVTQEYSPDEMFIQQMVHWNPVCSVSAANVANGHFGHIMVYGSPRTAFEMLGVDSGARKRSRDITIDHIYSDNDAAPCRTDQPLINIDSDFCRMGMLHVKGSRKSHGATHRPVVKFSGERIKGDITVMSSSGHFSPRFEIDGQHHDLTISAGGVHGDERAKLINGKASIGGVTVV